MQIMRGIQATMMMMTTRRSQKSIDEENLKSFRNLVSHVLEYENFYNEINSYMNFYVIY